jgi:SAM-dependent methyltransferase
MDIGCGSGDVAFELTRRVGSTGQVVGVDLDDVKLDLARKQAEANRMSGVEFRRADVTELSGEPTFDLLYARFVLTHLKDPLAALKRWGRILRPGGVILLEDIDFSGYFCHPPSPAHRRYVELYAKTVQSKGADPDIGPRLPSLLAAAGFSRIQLNVVQPMGVVGEVKLLPPLTMKTIADAVIAENQARPDEVEKLVAELFALAQDSTTVMGFPRVVQAWGRLP